MQRHLLYTLPVEHEAANHTVLRLTVGEVSALGIAKYQRLLREGRQWTIDRFGELPAQDDEEEETPEADPERNEWEDLLFARACMLAALLKVEEGECTAQEAEPVSWVKAQLPEEWTTPEGFANGINGKLYTAWQQAALECNPNMFFVNLNDPNGRRPGDVLVKKL